MDKLDACSTGVNGGNLRSSPPGSEKGNTQKETNLHVNPLCDDSIHVPRAFSQSKLNSAPNQSPLKNSESDQFMYRSHPYWECTLGGRGEHKEDYDNACCSDNFTCQIVQSKSGSSNGSGRWRSPLFSRPTNHSPTGRKLANYHLIPNPITGKVNIQNVYR